MSTQEEVNRHSKGRGQKKKRDYVGKIPNKIAEVIWDTYDNDSIDKS